MQYENQSKLIPRWVFFTGSTALVEGQGVCYNHDYLTTETGETATDPFGKRDKVVEAVGTSNNQSFAGVCTANYAAKTGGQWILINEPGSFCYVRTTETSLTLGDKIFLGCAIDDTYNGYFQSTGASKGRGMFRVMQTISAAGLVFGELMTGDESGLIQNVVLAAEGGAITAPAAGAAVIVDGSAVVTDHATFTLADGTFIGQRTLILISKTVGTSKNLVVTVTNGLKIDDTALSTLTFNTAGEMALLEWTGSKHKVISTLGTTVA